MVLGVVREASASMFASKPNPGAFMQCWMHHLNDSSKVHHNIKITKAISASSSKDHSTLKLRGSGVSGVGTVCLAPRV